MIKRPLLIIAGGFVLGEVFALFSVEIGIAFLAILLIFIGYQIKLKRRGTIPWLLFLFCIVGMIRFTNERNLAIPNWEMSRSYLIEGYIKEVRERDEYCEIRIEDWCVINEIANPMPYQAIVTLQNQDYQRLTQQQPLRLGMLLSVNGKIEEFEQARNPGEFDLRKYYRANEILYRITGDHPELINSQYHLYWDALARIRTALKSTLIELCEPEDAGIFASVILGDKTEIDIEIKELYQRNGIAHLLAISGLHISIIGMGIYQLLRKLGLNFGLSGIITAIIMISYGMLTGGSPSVIRAIVMFLCSMLARYLGRTYDLLSALSLAAVLLLWDKPYLISEAGFQLSFGAVIAIGALSPSLHHYLNPTTAWKKGVLVSVAIHMITYPIIIYHFFQYPIYSAVINMIVIPLMEYVMVSGIVGILVGMWIKWAGILILGTGHYILRFYEFLCRCFEQLPAAGMVSGRPQLWQIGFYYLLLILLLFVLPLLQRKERWQWMMVMSSICFGIICLWQIPVTGLQITFLDVGQGDGIVLQTQDYNILFDAGSTSIKTLGKRRLEPFLRSKGITLLDYVFVSHADQDHISGIQFLLTQAREIKISNLILPVHGKNDPAYQSLIEMADQHGSRVYWMGGGEWIEIGQLKIECLYPAETDPITEINEHSSVLLLSYDQFRLLLTGDMSSNQEQQILNNPLLASKLEPVHVLKVAHHGSRYSSSESWIEYLSPTWAVVSYGQRNSYGHPHPEIVERMDRFEVEMWKTAEAGAIILKTDGKRINWRTFLPVNVKTLN